MPSELAIEIAELRGYTKRISGQWQKPDGYGGIMVVDKLPQPDTDPADCMELLRYVLDSKEGLSMRIFKTDSQYPNPALKYWATIDWYITEGDTLELAITTACRDALRAIK